MRRRNFESELTGAQLRAARGLLNLSAPDLAKVTKVSLRTIRRAEQTEGRVEINAANAERLKSVLEGKGVTFITEDDGTEGVTLKPSSGRRKNSG